MSLDLPPPRPRRRAGRRAVQLTRHDAGAVGAPASRPRRALPRPHLRPSRATARRRSRSRRARWSRSRTVCSRSSTSSGSSVSRCAASRSAGWSGWRSRWRHPSGSSVSSSPARRRTSARRRDGRSARGSSAPRGWRRSPTIVVGRWFTTALAREEPETVARFRAMLAATPPEGYARCCEAVGAWDARERISAIAAPVLVIAGDEDPATPVAHAELIASRVAGCAAGGPRARSTSRQRRAGGRLHRGRARASRTGGGSVSDDGMKTRREVLGDEHVDRAIAGTTDFTADFQDLITRYAWGEIWSRPGLDRRHAELHHDHGARRDRPRARARDARARRAAQRGHAGRDQGGSAPVRRLLRCTRGQRRVRDRPARPRGEQGGG